MPRKKKQVIDKNAGGPVKIRITRRPKVKGPDTEPVITDSVDKDILEVLESITPPVPATPVTVATPAVPPVISGNGKHKKEKMMPVIWTDDRFWDTGRVRESKIPPNARLYDFDGEWVYLLRRFDTENGYRYEPFPVNIGSEENVTPAKLGDITDWSDLRDLFTAEPPSYEKLEKGLLVAFIICGFIFLFLIVVIMLGGE
jgi:hypothetical protein